MPKKETLETQYMIRDLGRKLGFNSYIEEQIHTKDTYAPIYDVVWYLDLEKYYDLDKLQKLFENEPEWLDKLKKLPFAGFEIEGSTTSSKNQLSNFANLYCGNFIYNFVIVNNESAGNEKDTYRRGVKLKRYFAENSGDKNVFFMDKIHLVHSIEKINKIDFDKTDLCLNLINENIEERGTYGGETKSVPMYDSIRTIIEGTGMIVKQNYQPVIDKIRYKILQKAKGVDKYSQFCLNQLYYIEPYKMKSKLSTSVRDSFYIPKLDVVLGFNAPKSFQKWMALLADEYKHGIVEYPILYGLKYSIIKELFVPLISIEIESTINKHLNGGIFNMSKNSYVGVLVTYEQAQKHVMYFRQELGLKNVISYQIK